MIIFIQFISFIVIKNQISSINKGFKEKYIILLTNLLGITTLILSNDWILTIISWELFNMSLYLLVSLREKTDNESGLAAALKYFLLSALSTAFLLIGVCCLYAYTGSTNYEIIDTIISEFQFLTPQIPLGLELAICLILFTLLFKLSAAPFYQWAPDLYENLSTKITKWMIIVPKISVLAFLFFLFDNFNGFIQFPSISYILLISGSLSLIIGSIALNNMWLIKRFFAYSGISHIGFMLLALYALSYQGFIIYLIIYAITTVNLFTIFIILSEFFGRDLKFINDLEGIFKFNPILSIALAINLFSLAGVYLL